MPTTPDRPAFGADRPAGPDEPLTVTEAAVAAARDTVPLDVRPREPADVDGRGNEPGGSRSRGAEAGARSGEAGEGRSRRASGSHDRETVRIAPGQRQPASSPTRDTVVLPRGRLRRPGRAPLVVAVGFATLWAALVSYLPVAVVVGLARTLEGSGGIAGSALAGLAAWLLGHGVPLGTSIGTVGLSPLLLTLLAGWRLIRAGVHVTRAVGARHSGRVRDAVAVAAAVGVGYGALGVLAALAVAAPGLAVSVPRAGGALAAVGFLGALIGALRCTDAVLVLARRMPPAIRHGLRTGVTAALLVLACGAGFAGLSVAIGGGQAAEMIGAYRTGVAGQAGITLVSLAYGANAAVWAAAYLLGPGFLLGAGTAVRLTEVTVGPLPTVPLLAGLPEGAVGATGAALLAVPVLAGMAAGWLLTRRLIRSGRRGAGQTSARSGPDGPVAAGGPGWPLVIGAATFAGPVAGLLLGTLAWLSSGPLGAGRLAEIGPVPWQVGVVGAAVVAVSTSLGAAAARGFSTSTRA